MSEKKGLAANALGAVESAVMGIAGTAPAYSIAATTAKIVGAVGVLSVASLFYCGWIMFGIMLAYVHLNKLDPNAGAAYAWVGRVFGRPLGFMAGWGLLVASVVFMVSATVPAATATLTILAPDQVENVNWVTAVGALWLTAVSLVVGRGIKHASYVQVLLTVLETVVIFTLIIAAFVRFSSEPVHVPSLTWLSPLAFTPGTFASGALTAIFFYWGWDVTMNLAEESKGGAHNAANRGAFWAMLNLILFFGIMLVAILLVLSNQEIEEAETNVLFAMANKLFPWPWGYLAVIAVLLSTVGTIETQLLQFSRSLFAMARDKMFHPRYATVHPEWQTPWVATLVMWLLGVVLLFGFSYLETVKQIIDASVDAICFQICFYMSLAGFACAWHYRRKLWSGVWDAASCVVWPLLSAAFMVFIAGYSVTEFGAVKIAVGLGGLALGLLPLGFSMLFPRK